MFGIVFRMGASNEKTKIHCWLLWSIYYDCLLILKAASQLWKLSRWLIWQQSNSQLLDVLRIGSRSIIVFQWPLIINLLRERKIKTRAKTIITDGWATGATGLLKLADLKLNIEYEKIFMVIRSSEQTSQKCLWKKRGEEKNVLWERKSENCGGVDSKYFTFSCAVATFESLIWN